MPEHLKRVEGTSRFPTTSWTLIVNAQDLDHKVSREALGTFCGTYWYPVFAFIRRKGLDSDQARDCTQEFFAVLLENDYLAGVIRVFLGNESVAANLAALERRIFGSRFRCIETVLDWRGGSWGKYCYGAIKVAIRRLRKRYRDVLRAEIAETVADPTQVDDEIRYLLTVLARGEKAM
jgi:hypothetical protein